MNYIFALPVYCNEYSQGSSWKQFLSGVPYPVTRSWPESVSEVSAECEFPAKIKINVMAEVSSPTREICNSLSLSTQKWVMNDCTPRQKKAASEWLCNEPLSLIQCRKPTKVKAVHKAWMALLGQFRQAEAIIMVHSKTLTLRLMSLS